MRYFLVVVAAGGALVTGLAIALQQVGGGWGLVVAVLALAGPVLLLSLALLPWLRSYNVAIGENRWVAGSACTLTVSLALARLFRGTDFLVVSGQFFVPGGQMDLALTRARWLVPGLSIGLGIVVAGIPVCVLWPVVLTGIQRSLPRAPHLALLAVLIYLLGWGATATAGRTHVAAQGRTFLGQQVDLRTAPELPSRSYWDTEQSVRVPPAPNWDLHVAALAPGLLVRRGGFVRGELASFHAEELVLWSGFWHWNLGYTYTGGA